MTEERSNSQRAREVFAEKDAREREEREEARGQTTPRQAGGLRTLAKGLATICFLFGALLLVAFSNLILSGDQSVLAQIELGIWAMCFFLAAIYLKLGNT